MSNSEEIRGTTNLTLTLRDDDSGAETTAKLNLFGEPKDKAVRTLTACREALVELGVITRKDCHDRSKEGPGSRPGADGQPG